MHAVRIPTEAPPPRMAPLARLPVFLALDGKRALVAGNGAAAAWKAELLSAAGATVEVYGEAAGDDLRGVAAHPPRGAIVLHARGWEASDFADAAIAVGEFDDDAEAARFAAGGAVAGRSGQRDRQAGVLRFRLRRDRQPLAAGDRNFDRRRRAGVRPGDPRPDRGADPARLRPLGRGGAALAHRAAAVRIADSGAAADSGSGSPRSRSRIRSASRRPPTSTG